MTTSTNGSLVSGADVVKAGKAVNYTVEQAAGIVADYTGGMTVEAIALATGRSVRSITAKLSREKVYVKKAYTTKTGAKVEKKDDLADKLAALVGFTEAEAESLTKANKTALAKLVQMAEAFKGDTE